MNEYLEEHVEYSKSGCLRQHELGINKRLIKGTFIVCMHVVWFLSYIIGSRMQKSCYTGVCESDDHEKKKLLTVVRSRNI